MVLFNMEYVLVHQRQSDKCGLKERQHKLYMALARLLLCVYVGHAGKETLYRVLDLVTF